MQNKGINWAFVKKLATAFSEIESVNLNKYNKNRICSYECYGNELQGKNIKFITEKGKAPFIDDNSYTVYEFPLKSNTGNPVGKYFGMYYNESFDYWLIGFLTAEEDVYDKNYIFKPLGMYRVKETYNKFNIEKFVRGYACTYGGKNSSLHTFDQFNSRYFAYGLL